MTCMLRLAAPIIDLSDCPLWIKSRHVQCTRRCLLCASSGHSRNVLREKERPPRGGPSDIRIGILIRRFSGVGMPTLCQRLRNQYKKDTASLSAVPRRRRCNMLILHGPQLNKDLEMPNLDSRHRLWSNPDEEYWAHFLLVASTICVASALWIGGIIAPIQRNSRDFG